MRRTVLAAVVVPLLSGTAFALAECRDTSVAELQLMTLGELDREFCRDALNGDSTRAMALITQKYVIEQKGLDNQLTVLDAQKALLGARDDGTTERSRAETEREAQKGRDMQRNAEQCDATLDRIRLVLRSSHKAEPPQCDGYLPKPRAAAVAPASSKKAAKKH